MCDLSEFRINRVARCVIIAVIVMPLVLFAAPPKSAVPAINEAIAGPDFELKIDIENGHIGHVFIGCKEGATDGFDSRIDDMAPPPGMGGIGFTFLVSPDKKFNLYKDIRGFAESVHWLFYAKTGAKPVTLSWDPKLIPDGWTLRCGFSDGYSTQPSSPIDCRETLSIEAKNSSFILFWIARKNGEQ